MLPVYAVIFMLIVVAYCLKILYLQTDALLTIEWPDKINLFPASPGG